MPAKPRGGLGCGIRIGVTLDGMVAGSGAVFEAKFMLPWSFSEEAAAEKPSTTNRYCRPRSSLAHQHPLLLVVTVVAPEARGLVPGYRHCVVSEFVKGLKGSAGDDVSLVIKHEADDLTLARSRSFGVIADRLCIKEIMEAPEVTDRISSGAI